MGVSLKFRVPYKVIQQGREFAQKVYDLRFVGNKDKFVTGGELEADKKGLEVEFAHAFVFGQPFPQLFEGSEVDEFDSELMVKLKNEFKLLKFDIKCSDKFLINYKQFWKKKVDAYLFESLEFLDFKQDLIFLKVHGWLEKKDVVKYSDLIKFDNGSKDYSVKKSALKSADLLFSLRKGEGFNE